MRKNGEAEKASEHINALFHEDPEIWGILEPLDGSELVKLGKQRICGPCEQCAKRKEAERKGLSKDECMHSDSLGSDTIAGDCDLQLPLDEKDVRLCVLFKARCSYARNGDVDGCFLRKLSDFYLAVSGRDAGCSNGSRFPDVPLSLHNSRQLRNGDVIKMEKGIGYRFYMPDRPLSRSVHEQFEFIEIVGGGHFADVWLVRDRDTSRKLAIKVQRAPSFHGYSQAALHNEIGILMSASHSHILCIEAVYVEDHIYSVMEYLPCGELFQLVAENRTLTEQKTRVIMRQLLSAVNYLHDREIVHSDIKPENIGFASLDPIDLRLMDFGMAHIVKLGDSTFEGGTPAYTAPEVVWGDERSEPTAMSDMWSIGCVMYVCLGGYPPFSKEMEPPTLKEQISKGLYEFPSPWWDNVSDEALSLIERLLTVNPAERISAADALEHPWITRED